MKTAVLVVFLLELISSGILAVVQEKSADDRAKLPTCKNPKGTIGETKISGCKKLVCIRKKNRAYWAESFASSICCSYQNVGYKIGATITTTVGKDNCTKVALKCGGEKGYPKIDILIDNEECAHNSFDDLAERFNVVKAALDKLVNSTELLISESKSTCSSNISTTPSTLMPTTMVSPTSVQTTGFSEETTSQCPTYNCENCISSSTSPTLSSDAPGSELLFLDFEILNFPSLSATNCTVPTKHSPTKDTEGYVATIITDGIMICGGRLYDGFRWQGSTNKCFLLTNDGFWLSSPLIASMSSVRKDAAAVHFDGGWWVIGGNNGSADVATSEIFYEHNKTWVPSSVDYPVPVQGHCIVKINDTHIFSSGGQGNWHAHDWSQTYIYSKATGFVQQESMTKKIYNYKHTCALFEGKIYVTSIRSPGSGRSVEYFSLASQTWESSPMLVPSLPYGIEQGLLMVLDRSLNFIATYRTKKIFKLEEIVWSSYTHFEWQEVGVHKIAGNNLNPLRWNVTDCENWNS